MFFVCHSCRQVVQRLYSRQKGLRTLRFDVALGSKHPEQRRDIHGIRSQCQILRTSQSSVLPEPNVGISTSSCIQRTAGENTQRPKAQSTIDEEEVNKFSSLAELWWDEAGEFEALHTMNELRIPLIRDALIIQSQKQSVKPSLPLEGLKVVDVGSGGGILSEPLARLGAFVIGVDASEENIKIAQAHVIHEPKVAQNIKYIKATVEDLAMTEAGKFDAVVASEVVEHVAGAATFIKACCQLVKPGGSVFITTLNKTYLSYGIGVVAAENLLRLVSPGTHDWNKFISPQDLQYILDQNQFSTRLLHGMLYNPLTKRWSWTKNTSINYALHAVKASGSSDSTPTD